MADLTEYPANMAPKDALIVRQEAPADHAMVQYSGTALSSTALGPANPFRSSHAEQGGLKRKNVPTGHAEETFISEHTFRSKHRAIERRGGTEREYVTNAQVKQEAARLRALRESKGSALVAEGDNAYVGPWARTRREEYETVEVEDEAELGSDEEYEIVEEEEDEVVPSGTVVQAPAQSVARRKEAEALGSETTTFHGESEYDYQGRTYMHVPQDLDIDLRKEVGSVANYIPKKLIHTWKHHTGGVTAVRLFPRSSHLGLSSGNDGMVKLFDVYHNRELLRTYAGHSKAVCDIDFNRDGTQFISASYDKQMKLWDTETGACVNRFSCGKTPFVVRFSPSAEHAHEFLAGTTKKILQYDSRAGNEIVQEYDHHLGPINTLVFVDGGDRFMSTSDDRSLRVWDYGIPVPIKYIADPDQFALTSAARHPNGKCVLYQASNEIQVYSANDKFRQNRKKSYRGHNTAGSKIDLAVSPDGQFVTSGDTGGFVVFWDYKTSKMYHKIEASKSAINCVVWSEQETSKVFTAGADSAIKLWD